MSPLLGCAELGATRLLVLASPPPHADSNAEAIARDLRKLSLLAIPLGIRIAFMGMPWSRTVRDFRAAGDLVFRTACPNLGLSIDAFDVLAAGAALEDLDAIDPEQIFLVQLSDFMWQAMRSPEEQTSTATHFRVFPGEGAHSEGLARFVTKLDAIGYMGDYSFDVYNDDYLQIPPEVVAARARQAALWLGETVLRRALPIPDMQRLRPSKVGQ
jgi:sugar phosphate isomerase/epimerase